jgi:phosphoserine phosphatase RsbU/P
MAFDANDTLARLADLSQALAQSLNIEATLKEAITRITSYMEAEAAGLFLLDESGEMLICRACAGPVNVLGMRLPTTKGIVGRTLQSNAPQLVADAASDPDFAGQVDRATGFTTRTTASAPLNTAEGPIGVLQVINKTGNRQFDERDRDVLRLLAAPTALSINNARMAGQLIEQERLKREFQLARRLQKSLLPKRQRSSFPLLGTNIPAREISGDFFDFFELPDGRIGFTAGDVSGKGMDAALLMVRAQSVLRWLGKALTPPSAWLERANDELSENMTRGMFVCAIVGYYTPDSTQVEWANAGFPPALMRFDDGAIEQYQADGPPLGIMTGMHYAERQLKVGAGTLYFFSDGVTDVRDADRGLLGVDGVKQLISEFAGEPAELRLRAIVNYLRRLSLADDTTILLIEDRLRLRESRLLELGFTAEPENLRLVRAALTDALSRADIDEKLIQLLILVVDEACANIIRHAYHGDPDGKIELKVSLKAHELEIQLRDYAAPVDRTCLKPRDLDEVRPGGLGLNLIDSVMDRWQLRKPAQGRGNVLVMGKKVG